MAEQDKTDWEGRYETRGGKSCGIWKKRNMNGTKDIFRLMSMRRSSLSKGIFKLLFLSWRSFFNSWIQKGPPDTIWLAAFFFPKDLITGFISFHTQSPTVSSTNLKLSLHTPDAEMRDKSDGIFIKGLFIEGDRWDASKNVLTQQLPRVCYDQLPTVCLGEEKLPSKNIVNSYSCPLYRLSERSNVLVQNIHLSNSILYVDMPSEEEEDYWTQREVAFIFQTDI